MILAAIKISYFDPFYQIVLCNNEKIGKGCMRKNISKSVQCAEKRVDGQWMHRKTYVKKIKLLNSVIF